MSKDTQWFIGICLGLVIFMTWATWLIATKPTDEEEHASLEAQNGWSYHTAQISTPADILVVLDRVNGVSCAKSQLQWQPCYFGDPTWYGTPFVMTWYGGTQ